MSIAYRPEIDGLRAIAVLSVLIYHAELAVYGQRLLPAGFLGVDVFFVISGFLITRILMVEVLNGTFSIGRFYERRARRILPVLFLVILCTMPFAWWLMLPDAMVDYAGSVITAILYGSNFWFWSSDSYWGQASALKPLLHTWSLSLEEQFYLIAPWVVVLLAHRKMAFVLLLSVLAFSSLAVAEIFSNTRPDTAFYLLPARAWELIVGSLVAVYSLSESSKKVDNPFVLNGLSGLGLVMIVYSVVFFDSSFQHPSLLTLVPVLGTGLVIAFGQQAKILRFITLKPMLWLGLISYSLYLWHFPIFAFLKVALIELSLLGKVGCLVASVVLAILSYRFVEKPFRDSRTVGLGKLLAILFTAMGLMLSLAAWAYITKGLPKRFDDFDGVLSYLHYPYKDSFLSHTCFLHPEELNAKIGFENCPLAAPANDGRPVLYLWGDSNAAHLIPGIKKKYEKSHDLVIRTVSGCGVFMTEHLPRRPGCNDLNAESLAQIVEIQPDWLVIGGWWKPEFVERLELTLSYLKDKNIKNVVVVGPVPEWKPSLPASIIKFQKENRGVRNFPTYLTDPVQMKIRETDLRMRKMVSHLGFKYYSSYDALCIDKGCLTNIDGKLTQWDYGHLTDEGSVYLIDGIKEIR